MSRDSDFTLRVDVPTWVDDTQIDFMRVVDEPVEAAAGGDLGEDELDGGCRTRNPPRRQIATDIPEE